MNIEKTVDRIYMLKQTIKSYENEIENLYSSIDFDLEPNHRYVCGDYILQVTETRRFDPVTARKVLTPEQFASIMKTKPDAAVAKAMLDSETYSATQKIFGLTKKVIPITDFEED